MLPVALPTLQEKTTLEKKIKRARYRLCCLGTLAALPIAIASTAIASTEAKANPTTPNVVTTPQTKSQLSFEQLMDVGYAASLQGDFHTALINFRRALVLRPNHPYASAAADNMAFYIEHARISARQQTIDQLESRLLRATAASDWVCAATTIDQLTMYTAPNSLNRERLIGQRGEISGMLDARLNYDAWSTVCAAQRPVY